MKNLLLVLALFVSVQSAWSQNYPQNNGRPTPRQNNGAGAELGMIVEKYGNQTLVCAVYEFAVVKTKFSGKTAVSQIQNAVTYDRYITEGGVAKRVADAVTDNFYVENAPSGVPYKKISAFGNNREINIQEQASGRFKLNRNNYAMVLLEFIENNCNF